MAAELIRPGVEVIQSLATASPSFARPTLVPCVVGPAFEVVNVLNTDGSTNPKAIYGSYAQVGENITESSFPDPRNNIDELDILEETVKPYMAFSGRLANLPMAPGSAFLATAHGASRAAIRTKSFGAGLDLNGKTLLFAIDQPSRSATALGKDCTVKFVGTLTARECADQINSVAGFEVATIPVGDDGNELTVVQIASQIYGALGSVTIRKAGTANAVLKIGYVSDAAAEERIEGAGWRGQDQSNNTFVTPWIEFYPGAYLVDGVEASIGGRAEAGLINIETNSYENALRATVSFGDQAGQIPLKAGDYFYADGLRLKDGEVMKVESGRFKVGTINTTLSTVDSNGNYISKVYNEEKVTILIDQSPFSPSRTYFKANGLDWRRLAPVVDSLLGSKKGTDATHAVLVGKTAVAANVAPGGTQLHYIITIDGVETEGYYPITGGPYADATALAADIHIDGLSVTANASNKLVFSTTASLTDHPGRLQSIVFKLDGDANSPLGLSTTSLEENTAVGKDVEFGATQATIFGSGGITFPLNGGTHDLNTKAITFQKTANATSATPTWSDVGTYTFSGEVTKADFLAALTTAFGANLVASYDDSTLVVKTSAYGADCGVRVKSTSDAEALAALNLVSGQYDLGTDQINGKSLKFKFDKNPHTYEAAFSANSLNLAVEEINRVVGAPVAAVSGDGSNQLLLVSTLAGLPSLVEVESSLTSSSFGLASSGTGGRGRPYPDAYLDDLSVLHVGSQILRDQSTGYPVDQSLNTATLYIQYKALRRDVSAIARQAGVLRLSDVNTLSQVLDPITEDNPLGLGLFMAMINAPTFEVKGLGVDEVTPAAPEGTQLAWARAAGFLEAEEVYAIAPLTQDEVVHGIWMTHATVMSQPEQGGERIVFFNKVMPLRKNPGVALSGTQANSTATSNQVKLDDNPAPGLIALGIDPSDPRGIAEDKMVYVEFEVAGQLRRYNVLSVRETIVNLRTSFSDTATNADGFFSTVMLNVPVVNAPYALKVRGASVVVPGSYPPRLDYSLVAETVAGSNESFKNRRAYSVFPDTIKTTIAGIEKKLPGYYACAAIAGMTAAQPPQQPFTNFPITGLTGVVGTEKFSKRQLNVMAGGGTYILIQDVQGGAVSSRHQLSTDLTSIETRELSITKVVDFVAKFMRLGLRKFIGTNVINPALLDSIGTTCHAILTFLEENGVLNGSNVNNLVQDESAPDTVIVDVTLEVPYPCNYIRLTLVV